MATIFDTEENENEFYNLVLTNPTSSNRALMTFLKALFKKDDDSINDNLQKFYGFVERISGEKKSKDFTCHCLDLLMGHSMIRESLLLRSNMNYRQNLLKLFCLLCEIQIEIVQFKDNIVDFILSIYDASLSIEDQRLLKILFSFESNSINLQKYQPFIWGINGANFYAQKHSQKLAFLVKPKIEEIFKDFIDSRFYNSLNEFPITVKYQTNKVKIIHDERLNRTNKFYDPRFVLPMFFHLLSCEALNKCHLFIRNGCLAYTVASLSSESKQLRAISYSILGRLHDHLECMNYPEDRQLWIGLIDFIRSNLTKNNQRLPSIQTVMFVKLIQIFLNPSLTMFKSAKFFILEQQEKDYDFMKMPTFYDYCLNRAPVTTSNEHDANVKFCLEWILLGLRTEDDVDVCGSGLFDNLMLMYSSGMASQENQILILQILIKLAGFMKGCWMLARKLNICLWLKNQMIIYSKIRQDSLDDSRGLFNKLIKIILESYLQYYCCDVENVQDNNAMEVDIQEEEDENSFYKRTHKVYPTFQWDIINIFCLTNNKPNLDIEHIFRRFFPSECSVSQEAVY